MHLKRVPVCTLNNKIKKWKREPSPFPNWNSSYFSLRNNSTTIRVMPSTINTTERINRNIKSISITVDNNLPMFGFQDKTKFKLFPAIITIAKDQMLPISERNPPINALFIQSLLRQIQVCLTVYTDTFPVSLYHKYERFSICYEHFSQNSFKQRSCTQVGKTQK